MIISRTPFRITLGGGGTDDPNYLKDSSGFAITAAISRHIYIGVNRMFGDGYLLRYSEVEHAATIEDVKHPILRHVLRYYRVPTGTEIISLADIPAGTGLGSSGAFTVGACKAMAAYTGARLHKEEAAALAARIELNLLKRPGGKQDHYATALGGVQTLRFHSDGYVTSAPLQIGPHNQRLLESSLSLFFTGYSRDADTILSTQTTDGLDHIKAAARIAEDMMMAGDLHGLGKLMDEHWQTKQQRSDDMSNDRIDWCYRHGLRNGAIGGKLVGAGGGGFLLFVADDPARLSAAMNEQGMQEVPFTFDHDGATLIAQ